MEDGQGPMVSVLLRRNAGGGFGEALVSKAGNALSPDVFEPKKRERRPLSPEEASGPAET